MKFKDRVLIQVVVSLTFLAVLNGTGIVNSEKVNDLKAEIRNQINTNYTINDIKVLSKDVVECVINLPTSFNEAITVANEMSYFTDPIDKNSKEDIVNVRAAAGGEVIFCGIDKELGACIRIQHENKISTYGNLHTIKVIVGDRVNKAQIIGTYDNKSLEEFYYQLEDSMV